MKNKGIILTQKNQTAHFIKYVYIAPAYSTKTNGAIPI